MGVTGLNSATFSANFGPAFRGETFVSIFAIYFPSATGILAGANISGDLKSASTAIPKGTILAIFLSQLSYIVCVWFIGASVVRDAPGPGNFTEIESIMDFTCNATTTECDYGLMNNYKMMEIASAWGPLIIVGTFAATLSSALATLVSAPKIFQAVCQDKIFPGIGFFNVPYGKNKEPIRAYFLAAVIAIACVCIGDLNIIAPIISNFFLMGYALVNYSCFDSSLSGSPGFRPSFRWYSKWLALIGAIVCIAIMFLMQYIAALATLVIAGLLYVYVNRVSKPDVNWGTSLDANIYRRALSAAKEAAETKKHVKNFRPQVRILWRIWTRKCFKFRKTVSFSTETTEMIGSVSQA